MKRAIFIVGVVSFVVILLLGAAIMTLGVVASLGHLSAHTQHPATILLILSVGLAILGWKANRTFHKYAVRKLREKGVPELPESRRMSIRFWTRATLTTICVLLVIILFIHHG